MEGLTPAWLLPRFSVELQLRFAGCPKINGVPKVEVVLLPKAWPDVFEEARKEEFGCTSSLEGLDLSAWSLSLDSVMSLAGDEMQFGPVPRRCPQAGGVVQAPQKRIRYLRVGMPGKLRRYNRLISIADVFVFQGLASRS